MSASSRMPLLLCSVIAFGRIHIIDDAAEKLATARMLMIRFDIEHLTGKESIELKRQRKN